MLPRPVLPAKTYLVTRRCSERRFFLRPSREVNQVIVYALGKATDDTSVRVHGWTAMSNHIHLALTDPVGELPAFMRILDLEISKALSPEIGRWGGFWEPHRSYSAVELLDREAVIEELAYILANPVAAGLVRRAAQWPGSTSFGLRFGERIVAPRPDVRYYRNSIQPLEHSFELTCPDCLDPATAAADIDMRVRRLENKAAKKLAAVGRDVVGRRQLLRQDPYDSPRTREKRRGLNPTFASRDRFARLEAAQRKKSWLEAYRAAYERWRLGDRTVEFPFGTWALRRYHGCRCAEPLSACA